MIELEYTEAASGLLTRGSELASGLDLRAHSIASFDGESVRIFREEDGRQFAWVPSVDYVAFDTGVSVAIPEGFDGHIRTRSSMFRRGLTCDGTIDADYRGTVFVLLWNIGLGGRKVYLGDRIAQLVIQPVIRPTLKVVTELSKTARGSGGFGSTGR